MCGQPIFQGSRPLIRRRPLSACGPARDQNARFGDVSPSALLDSGPALPAEPSSPTTSPGTHTHTHTLTHSHWYTGEDHVTGAGACSLNPSPRLAPLHPGARPDICTHCYATSSRRPHVSQKGGAKRPQDRLRQEPTCRSLLPCSLHPQSTNPQTREASASPSSSSKEWKGLFPAKTKSQGSDASSCLKEPEPGKTDQKHFPRHQTPGKEGW